MGAWISYGLGRLNESLPAFVVLPDPRGLPYNNQGNFSCGFLPAAHQGVIVRARIRGQFTIFLPPADAKEITPASERDGLALLRTIESPASAAQPGDSRLEARIESYELAARMQVSAGASRSVAGNGSDAEALRAG